MRKRQHYHAQVQRARAATSGVPSKRECSPTRSVSTECNEALCRKIEALQAEVAMLQLRRYSGRLDLLEDRVASELVRTNSEVASLKVQADEEAARAAEATQRVVSLSEQLLSDKRLITVARFRGEERTLNLHFDHVFQGCITNDEICDKLYFAARQTLMSYKPLTIFAYGSTGSGKTFTTLGNSSVRGLAQIFIDNILNDFVDATMKLTVSEVYLGKLKHSSMDITRANFDECLQRVQTSRRTASTRGNDKSSRSHLCLKFELKCDGKLTALHIVDLAGFEGYDTSTEQKETISINTSLSALTSCLIALHRRKPVLRSRDVLCEHLRKESVFDSVSLLIACIGESDASVLSLKALLG